MVTGIGAMIGPCEIEFQGEWALYERVVVLS